MSDGHEILITIGGLLLVFGFLIGPGGLLIHSIRRRSIVRHVRCGLIHPDLVVSL
jgi:hypothetical protein